jgi:hypothetical protein
MQSLNWPKAGALLLLFLLSTNGCRLFRPCPSCPPTPPAKVVVQKQRCMESFPAVAVPTIPAPNENGDVIITKQQLAELLIVVDQTLLYIKTQLAACAKDTDAPGSP